MSEKLTDINRLCVHTFTTKPWSLQEALEGYSEKGVRGISVWQNAIEEMGAQKAGDLIRQYPVDVVSYVRGGFFPSSDAGKRQEAIDHNKRMLDEAAAVGAPLLVLVCGAEPKISLAESREQIQAGIEAILPHAKSVGVKLGIEPLHPMYADTRSAITTLGQSNDMAIAVDDDYLGVVIDVYHLWWDDKLEAEITRCGDHDKLFAFHVCDWKVPTEDMLLDRGLMGEGCINVPQIRSWVENTGFDGYIEVEIFSNHYWSMDQGEYIDKIIEAYLQHT